MATIPVVTSVSSISIKNYPTEIHYGSRVRMKKDFVTIAHFSLGLGKHLVPLDVKIPRKCFDFR